MAESGTGIAIIDSDEYLISLVQNYSFLYDQSQEYYRNKTKRELAWINISKQIGNMTGQCKNFLSFAIYIGTMYFYHPYSCSMQC